MDLNERAILVSLKISVPNSTRRDKQATEDVEAKHNSRDLGRFNKDLINKKFLQNLRHVEACARQHYYGATAPWGDDDSRILAARTQLKFATKMNEFGADFDNEAANVINQWPLIIAEAKQRLGVLFNPNEYPPESALPNKFKFRVRYFPVPTAGDIRVSLDEQQLAELRHRLALDVQEHVALTNANSWQRLYDRVAHMADVLSRDRTRIHDTLVENMRDICEVLPDLNFTNDPKLDKAIALVKAKLIVPVEALRDQPEVKQNTAFAAKKIAEAMSGWMRKE